MYLNMALLVVMDQNVFFFFIDDYSKLFRSYTIKNKSDVLDCFRKYKNEVECLDGVIVSELRSDNGGEYGAEYETSGKVLQVSRYHADYGTFSHT